MRVKIINATPVEGHMPWYKEHIGETFEVSEDTVELNDTNNYQVVESGKVTRKCIECCDVELISK